MPSNKQEKDNVIKVKYLKRSHEKSQTLLPRILGSVPKQKIRITNGNEAHHQKIIF